MPDFIHIGVGQGIQASSGAWYRNIQQIGAGGNAVTFLMHCTEGRYRGVVLALKIFVRLSEARRRERFLQEIEYLKEFSHPTIMRVFDEGVFRIRHDGEDSDYPFVVVEYLPLRLSDVMRAREATTVEKLSYAVELLSALNYLAQRDPQVVHRDIKPQNIFVKGRSCVLGDFGLMKVLNLDDELDRRVFEDSVRPGMPYYYRTPDLVAYVRDGVPLTVKSDVFQLGLVLTELFTGRNPGRVPQNILDPVELEPIGDIPGRYSGAIFRALQRMLVMDPDARADVAALLDHWQGIFDDAIQGVHNLEGRVFR